MDDHFEQHGNGPGVDLGHLSSKEQKKELFPNRKDLQLARRFFHMCMGVSVAGLYGLFLEHNTAVAFIGTIACFIYLIEQIRISYPEYAEKFNKISKVIYRAEERLKESAAIPYAMAVLLTILIFPKKIAVASILILALADPLSAIIGIRWGKKRVFAHKSLEGSAAFYCSSLLCIVITYYFHLSNAPLGEIFIFASIASFFCSVVETLPIRLDDNLTIPLSSALILWILGLFFHF